MSGCHVPYIVGSAAFANLPFVEDKPQTANFCGCPCHSSTWMSIYPPKCWCQCGVTAKTITLVTDNSMQEVIQLRKEVAVLRITVERLIAEKKEPQKTPYKCPVCKGLGIHPEFSDERECAACKKGIVWG